MRNIRKTLRGLTALMWALLLCVSATAGTWLSDDFDIYDLGQLGGQGGWSSSSGIRVETDLVMSGKAVEANYLSWGVDSAIRLVSSGGGYHYIDLDVAMDTQSPTVGEDLGYLCIYNQSGAELTRLCFSHQRLKVLLGSATTIQDNVAARTWYHVCLGLNLSTSKIDVWVNGVRKITQGTLYGSGTSISRVTFGQLSGLGTRFTKSEQFIDNLVCRTMDELPTGNSFKALPPVYPWTAWERFHVCFPFVFFDAAAGKYKMYYTGSAADQTNENCWDQWQTGIATSTDTVNWLRPQDNYEPVLYARKFTEGELVDPANMPDEFDCIHAMGACLIKEDGVYKVWYTGWNGDSEHVSDGITKKINWRIGYATSTDGIAWTKYHGSAGQGAVLGLGTAGGTESKGVGQPYVIKEGSTYRMWYEGYDGSVWRIFYAASPDGITWTKQGAVLNPGSTGSLDQKGARNPVVISRNGQYELWYQGESTASPNFHVLRATSANGITWSKVTGEITLHPDDSVSGDEKVHVDSIIVLPDDNPQLFYAKENIITESHVYGTLSFKSYNIYTEVVDL